MEREDQEVARLAQLVKNYFIPPVTYSHNIQANQYTFLIADHPTDWTDIFTDGKSPDVRGLSEAPVKLFKIVKVSAAGLFETNLSC